MGRGSDTANTAASTAQTLSGTYAGNAGSIYGTLAPMLESQAANPQGMSPVDIARADTASEESAGGGMAAAVGQGALKAARTRNIGGSDAAIGEAARGTGRNLAESTLKTRMADSEMKNSNRRGAMSGLGNLFSENLAGGNQALGQVAGDVNANTNAENASWDWSKDLFMPLLGAAGSAAPTIGKAFGVH